MVEISIVVSSHDRPLRLRWLLNALEDQTLAPERFEVIVAHDSVGPETDALLDSHPLGHRVVLRAIRFPAGSAPPGRNRNAGWRAATAPLVAFTDDACRPPADWLQRAVEAAQRHPGAIVQGLTLPDEDATAILWHASWTDTQRIEPPTPWAEACNIIYPRAALEATGGFPEDMNIGEDTALAESARALGFEHVGAREVVTYHAVVELSMLGVFRGAWRWRDLPLLIRRHPRLRDELPLLAFWRPEHVLFPLAVLGWLGLRRSRLAVLLLLPYLARATPRKYGSTPRGLLRAAVGAPGWIGITPAEIAALAWGSVKHRTFLL